MSTEQPPRNVSQWIVVPVALIIIAALVNVLNRPGWDRLETARRELSLAGHPGARVDKSQIPRNMIRCEVSQMRENRGSAYGWKTETEAGVFCLPTDGRPTRILLD